MPRPNPENKTRSAPWSSNYAGSGTFNWSEFYRTYASTNTPGYPIVKWDNPHTMDLKEQLLDSTAWWASETLSPWYSVTWFSGPLDAASRGVPNSFRVHLDDGEDALRLAKARLINEVKRSKTNIAVSLAEAGQAFRMFGSTTKRIISAYRALRHGDVEGLRRSIYVKPKHEASLLRRGPLDIRRHAPSLWLELQYGWKPLLSDMYGAVTQLHSRVEEGYPIRARASARRSRKRRENTPVTGITYWDVQQAQTSRAKLMVDYWVDSSFSANLNDWGLTNPLEVVWELVPYSFVVDWFIPVGNYLSTFDAYLGVTFKRGFEVLYRETTTEAKLKTVQAPSAAHRYTCKGNDRFKHKTYVRNVLTAFPRASLPRLKNPFSALHVANAISLLSLAFDRKR